MYTFNKNVWFQFHTNDFSIIWSIDYNPTVIETTFNVMQWNSLEKQPVQVSTIVL